MRDGKSDAGRNWKDKAFFWSGWAAAALMGVLNFPAAVNSFRKEFPSAAEGMGIYRPVDARLNGDWALTETCKPDPFDVGELTEGKPGDATRGSGLDMTLAFAADGISGEVMSKGLSENFIYPQATITGVAAGQTAHIRVFDWIDAKPITVADIELTRTKEGCIEFEVINQTEKFFPDRAILAKREKNYYASRSREGGIMQRVFSDAIKNAAAQTPALKN